MRFLVILIKIRKIIIKIIKKWDTLTISQTIQEEGISLIETIITDLLLLIEIEETIIIQKEMIITKMGMEEGEEKLVVLLDIKEMKTDQTTLPSNLTKGTRIQAISGAITTMNIKETLHLARPINIEGIILTKITTEEIISMGITKKIIRMDGIKRMIIIEEIFSRAIKTIMEVKINQVFF